MNDGIQWLGVFQAEVPMGELLSTLLPDLPATARIVIKKKSSGDQKPWKYR